MIQETLQLLGFSKNEAKIYEVLLSGNGLGVSDISKKAEVNRRNVYDSLKRLIEKGFVFEVKYGLMSLYKAVDPQKLVEIVNKQRRKLEDAFPKLNKLYKSTPKNEEIYIYKGKEGWKLYLRDIIEVGKEVHAIGGKMIYFEEQLKEEMAWFLKEFKSLNVNFTAIFDQEAKLKGENHKKIHNFKFKFFPKEYSTDVTIDIYGDRVVFLHDQVPGDFDENHTITVIINQALADAYRTWFKYLWESLK